MKEVFVIGTRILILASFGALIVFYGFVFWHWRNEAKRRGLSRGNWPDSITSSRPAK
jgi:hypothetical protein